VRSREWEVGCREKRKAFFFEKKAAPALREAKTFVPAVARAVRVTGQSVSGCVEVKVFWFFFSKKNCFLNA
jgi:hypothetical protein